MNLRTRITFALTLIVVAALALIALTVSRVASPARGPITAPSVPQQQASSALGQLPAGVTASTAIGGKISSISKNSFVIESDAAGPDQLRPYTVEINSATQITAQKMTTHAASSTTASSPVAVVTETVTADALKAGQRVVVTPPAEIRSDAKSFVAAKILIIALPAAR